MDGRRVAWQAQGYIAAIDEKAWAGPRRLGPGVQGFPTAWSRHANETGSRAVREAQGRGHPFGAGAGSAGPVVGRGEQAVVRRTVQMRRLRRLARPLACDQ